MKRKILLNILAVLIFLSLLGIGYILITDWTRSPTDHLTLAHEQLALKNNRQALRHMLRAANSGLPQAQYELALLYDAGDKIPENRDLAKKYMAMALESNLPEAHYVTAVWTERGYFGAPDIPSAIQHYEQAAKKGHLNAIKTLIVLYGEGSDELPSNPEKQQYWIKKLEKKGNKK